MTDSQRSEDEERRERGEDEDRSELEERHSRDPAANPGDLSHDPHPHSALSNPVGEPDETEWPDPYERREDPREDAPAPAPPSTSEPPPPIDHSKVKPAKGSREGG
jgi:hypothetical protein